MQNLYNDRIREVKIYLKTVLRMTWGCVAADVIVNGKCI